MTNFTGSDRILYVLVDGLRHDYFKIYPELYISRLASESVCARLYEPLSFELRPVYFAGLDPDASGIAHKYLYSPETSPYGFFRMLHGSFDMIPRFNWRIRKYVSIVLENLYRNRYNGHDLSTYEIPLTFLPYFDRSEKKYPAAEGYLGEKTVFDMLRERKLPFLHCGYPDRDLKARSVFKYFKAGYNKNTRFVFLHFDEADYAGHLHGPASAEVGRALAGIDDAVKGAAAEMSKNGEKTDIVVFGDHGMSEVQNRIYPFNFLDKPVDALKKGYLYFIDSTQIRIWFLNDAIKQEVIVRLNNIGNGLLAERKDIEKLAGPASHREYGDLYFLLKGGNVFFPDFFGSGTPNKGMHGYLPECGDNHSAALFHSGSKSLAAKKNGPLPLKSVYFSLLTLMGIDAPGREDYSAIGIMNG